MSRRLRTARILSTLTGLGLLVASTVTPAAATTVTPTCRAVANEEVPVAVTVAPGESLTFNLDGACGNGAGEFFGIRAVGARAGSTPATIGTTEYTVDGSTWLPVSVQQVGFNVPLAVRYTAPSGGVTSDAFYVVAAQLGSSYAGYLYTVTITGASSADPDLTSWQQATGRSSSTAPCPDGYSGSWAQWPHGGTGGWVCVREVPAYGPAAFR